MFSKAGRRITDQLDGLDARIPNAAQGSLLFRQKKQGMELRCGEGYASQQSRYIHLGLGEEEAIENLTIRWPSGRKSELTDIPQGSLVSVAEGSNKPDVSSWGDR